MFKAHRLVYHSTLGSRVINNKKRLDGRRTWVYLTERREQYTVSEVPLQRGTPVGPTPGSEVPLYRGTHVARYPFSEVVPV